MAAVAVAAALLPAAALTNATSASANPQTDPTPPARMSTIGGERLGRPGTQVNLGRNAPALPKGITSRAWIVADAESGDVLAAHNAHWPLAPASTLKMLFADLLLPRFPADRTHTVRPSDLADVGEGSSLVGIKENQTYTVRDLWLGVFLRSGNDAVHTLTAMNGGLEKTIREMNAHARMLRAEDTHVVTPDGYDAEGQTSSAYDLTLIARHGLQKADFREYASTARAQFPGEQKKGQKKRPTFEIQNTNRLLTGDYGMDPYKGAAGVKNGYTTNAGHTLTAVAQRGDRVLLVTALHPEGGGLRVYQETAKLLDWGFEAAGMVEPVGVLVPPRDEDPGPTPVGEEGASDDKGGGRDTADTREPEQPQGGVGTALTVVAGSLVVLAVGAYGVHRRWPLPTQALRRRRRPEPPTDGAGGAAAGRRLGAWLRSRRRRGGTEEP